MRKVEVSMRKMTKKAGKRRRKAAKRHSEKSLKGVIFQTNFHYGGTYYEKDLLQKGRRLNNIFTLNERDTKSIGKLM